MTHVEEYDASRYNPIAWKRRTYNILQHKYEEKLAKYNNANEQYKKTAEYARLVKIVTRLRATLAQMEQDLAR